MKQDKMWSGRFDGATNPQADSFNTSLPFDKRLYAHDIKGSIAHATMLSEQGIISRQDSALIIKALQEILQDIKDCKLNIDNGEDIHMFVEAELTRRIGYTGKRLHTARSRNDQVALDIRMYLKDECLEIIHMLKNCCAALLDSASDHTTSYVSGYTHLQHAQPITLAHYMLAYVSMFLRDIDRLKDCYKRTNVLPLGACALATTTLPINRERVAELLNFDSVSLNSLDAVSDRDFCIEILSDIALIMMHLSRISEEFILWSSSEFGYLSVDDAYSTGSSIMPNKKNPDMLELIRGKCGRAYGNLMSLLTTMKGLPLAYNKDMQEDKEAIFDSVDTVKACLAIFEPILKTNTYHTKRMQGSCLDGCAAATDIAEYLVRKDMPFREAHGVVGAIVRHCIQNNLELGGLSLNDYKKFSESFEDDILDCVKLNNIVSNRNIIGGPAPETVASAIKEYKSELEQ